MVLQPKTVVVWQSEKERKRTTSVLTVEIPRSLQKVAPARPKQMRLFYFVDDSDSDKEAPKVVGKLAAVDTKSFSQSSTESKIERGAVGAGNDDVHHQTVGVGFRCCNPSHVC